MKASGLLLSKATSIWSSDTLAGLFWTAILLALSPALTVTCLAPKGILSAGGVLAAGALATELAAGGESGLGVMSLAGSPALESGALDSTGAVGVVRVALLARRLGGSNSIV